MFYEPFAFDPVFIASLPEFNGSVVVDSFVTFVPSPASVALLSLAGVHRRRRPS